MKWKDISGWISRVGVVASLVALAGGLSGVWFWAMIITLFGNALPLFLEWDLKRRQRLLNKETYQ